MKRNLGTSLVRLVVKLNKNIKYFLSTPVISHRAMARENRKPTSLRRATMLAKVIHIHAWKQSPTALPIDKRTIELLSESDMRGHNGASFSRHLERQSHFHSHMYVLQRTRNIYTFYFFISVRELSVNTTEKWRCCLDKLFTRCVNNIAVRTK